MKKLKFVLMVVLCLSLSSCSPEFWGALLIGLTTPTYNSYSSYSSYSTTPTYSSSSSSYSGSTYSSGSSSSSSSSSSNKGQRTCSQCNGTGQVIKSGTGFGNRKWCSICGKEVADSHYHGTCPGCNGTGKW